MPDAPAGRGGGLPLRHAAILLGVSTIWGVNSVLSKAAVEIVPPLAFLTVRFAIVLLLSGWMMRGLGARWRTIGLVALMTGPLHFGTQFVGLSWASDLSPMVIAMQLWIPFSVLFSALFLKEPVAPRRAAGVAVSFAGVTLMAVEPSVLGQLDAFAMVALGAAAYAGASVLIARAGRIDPIQMQLWVAVASVPTLGLASGVLEAGQVAAFAGAGWLVWLAILFGGLVSSMVANAAMWSILQRHPVSQVTPWLQASPIVAVAGGVLFLGDVMTTQLALGMAVSLAGVILVALARAD
jgi:O-acetylserine/cysteine efflux transporter